jgi:hypothetical protein
MVLTMRTAARATSAMALAIVAVAAIPFMIYSPASRFVAVVAGPLLVVALALNALGRGTVGLRFAMSAGAAGSMVAAFALLTLLMAP